MDDLEFIRKCASGDKRAWDQFIDKYSRLIYSVIHHVCGLKYPRNVPQHVVEDLFQDVFLHLSKDNFSKLNTFKARNASSFAVWLRQVVVNRCIDYLRRERMMLSLDQEDEDEHTLKDLVPAPGADIFTQLEKKEWFSGLKECIEKLETGDKFFLEMLLGQELTLGQIKDVLRISRAAVDMRKARLMQRLRACFKEKGFQLDF